MISVITYGLLTETCLNKELLNKEEATIKKENDSGGGGGGQMKSEIYNRTCSVLRSHLDHPIFRLAFP